MTTQSFLNETKEVLEAELKSLLRVGVLVYGDDMRCIWQKDQCAWVTFTKPYQDMWAKIFQIADKLNMDQGALRELLINTRAEMKNARKPAKKQNFAAGNKYIRQIQK